MAKQKTFGERFHPKMESFEQCQHNMAITNMCNGVGCIIVFAEKAPSTALTESTGHAPTIAPQVQNIRPDNRGESFETNSKSTESKLCNIMPIIWDKI
jgi:hypothetical protein